MHVADIFSSYSIILPPGNLGIDSGLPFSKPRELQSHVHTVRFHHCWTIERGGGESVVTLLKQLCLF
jgi:hypothetical protein